VLAQPKADEMDSAVQRLSNCRPLADSAARLACYDATAAALDQAVAKGDIVVMDKAQAKEVRRQAFGFTLPSLSLFDRAGGERPEPLERVTATLASAHQGGEGKWVLELADGAVWRQVDLEPLPNGARKGSTVEIRKAAMGSFFINVDRQRAIRAQRSR
jgi:hypothetical protein